MNTLKPDDNTRKSGQGPKNIVKVSKKITETYLNNAGLYYLQRFASGTQHFREIMRRKIDRSCLHHADQDKAACYTMLETLIEKFIALGLLDDGVYARNAVASLRNRGLSKRAIIARLQNRGLSPAAVARALDDFNADHGIDGDTGDMDAAMKLARKKKVGPYAAGKEFDRTKALSAFARAGFSFEIARKVLDMNAEDALIDPFD